ncbi:hypothetical protein D9619_006264 [Psilocybe cf. subviscida]|uniref:Uncharacterized protein n=1 Tax=Psilocybe cf. subviscida TaxID=2480587 RepID=A0A8H5B4R6_9AGAR|nr:hypothetical protein D9619_006264 [Psilocybe cf. subviscida]
MYRNVSNTPPSSPPSSPASLSWTQSSSPLSSPTFRPVDLTSDDVADLSLESPIDPLAGSYHANLSKKRPSHVLLNSPPETPSKKARFNPNTSPFANTLGQSRSLDVDAFREKTLWEEAIETVFESGGRKIDLVGKNITRIPPNIIGDLSKMVLLPETGKAFEDVQARLMSTNPPAQRLFGRTRTAPASTHRFGPQGKTMSSNSVLGASRETMDLLLGQNSITKLPAELWGLQSLTLLSLRNNNITYLPPQIAQLTELVELNVAHNKLRFIPAELLSMKKLKKPFLFPNPYLLQPAQPAPPSTPTATLGPTAPPESPTASIHAKIVSKTQSIPDERVPSLTELCLRALLLPPIDVDVGGDDASASVLPSSQFSQSTSSRVKTRLEQTYELPLATGANSRGISNSLRGILGVCVPGSILVERDSTSTVVASQGPRHNGYAHDGDILANDADAATLEDESRIITGTGVCPNPAHGLIPSVFVHHAEERFTWETSTPVVATLGGAVAVRWRGCMRGCLDFLEPARPKVVEVTPSDGALPPETQRTEAGEAEVEMNLDLDEADIVQAFTISTEPLGFD